MENTKQTSGYNGRVIRRAHSDVEHKQDSEQPKNKIAKEALAELEECIASESNKLRGKEELIRSLRRNISSKHERHLIGVFGVNSDVLIKEALYEISHTDIARNITILPKSMLIEDEFCTFVGMMANFYKDNYSSSRYVAGVDMRREITRYLNAILCAPSAGYGQSGLSDAVLKLERHDKVKEMMDYINLVSYNRDNMFIWNLEVSAADFHPNLLNNLSKMVSKNFIIIVNYLRNTEAEALFIGGNYPVDDRDKQRFGYLLLQKYFGYSDLINTD